jgi:hypothetical protein
MVTIVPYLAIVIFVSLIHESFGFSSNNPQPRQPVPSGNKQSFTSIPNAEERTAVLLFYKPPNVVTSHVSPDDRSTVYDAITMAGFVGASSSGKSFAVSGKSFAETTGIYTKFNSVGRLDADTTGLLLLTNNGGSSASRHQSQRPDPYQKRSRDQNVRGAHNGSPHQRNIATSLGRY